VKVRLVTVAVAGGVLAALCAAGCGTRGAGPDRGTVAACTAFGVRAIQQRSTVTRMPAACEGLSKAEVNEAVGRAVYLVAGGRHKAAWRRQAYLVGARLGYLTSPAQAASSVRPAVAGPGPAPSRRSYAGLSLAALACWLLTAGSGSYILGRWISRGVVRRVLSGGPVFQPAVIVGHFGLAATGLAVWTAFAITGQAGLAWAGVGLLVPVAGLGMALLVLTSAAAPPARRRRMPVLAVVGHGVLASGTVLLVLLAALGAPAS
jgi:manganese efflux pump family protein